jgi:N-acetylmuramoyl-L-alanine amidase
MKSVKNIYYIIFAGLFLLYLLLIIFSFAHLNDFLSANNSSCDDVTIVLDAGHGGEDGGAVANEIVEKNINLTITKKLAQIFKASGSNVVTTRNSDTMIDTDGDTIRSRKVSDMKHRLSIFNENENNVVISIHLNKFDQEKYRGSQVFYSANNENSTLLAESIKNSIVSFIQPDNTRECKKATSDIYLLYNSTVPSVIVECGFISNFDEAKLLKSNDYQNQIVYAIYVGFLEYYN